MDTFKIVFFSNLPLFSAYNFTAPVSVLKIAYLNDHEVVAVFDRLYKYPVN